MPDKVAGSQLFGALLDAAVDGVVVIDESGTILNINRSGLELFGHTQSLIGESVNTLMPEVYAREHDGYIARYLKTGENRIIGIGREVEGLRKDGTTFPMDLSVGKGSIDGRRYFIGIVRDLTDRNALIHQLHERESEVRGLIENALVATGALDRNGNFLSWNDSFEKILRTSDLSERPIGDFLANSQGEPFSATIQTLVDEGGTALLSDQKFLVEDGEIEFIGDIFLSAITDVASPDSPIERLVVQFVDRTSQIEAERMAIEAQNHLAHLNRVGTLGEMAAGIAHEVNQPLGAIANYAQAARILLSNGASDSERLEGILGKISEQAQRAGEVIRRMRSLAGQHSSIRESCSLSPLIQEVVRLFETDARFEIASLGTHIEDDLPEISVDRVQIQQVLLNLLRNAVDAMKSLPISERNLEIRCVAGNAVDSLPDPDNPGQKTTPQGVVVEVIDSGHGIDAALADRIMNPFFSTKKDGMGMGLAICSSILSAHDGQLTFTNNQPQPGTTFRLFLPRKNSGSST